VSRPPRPAFQSHLHDYHPRAAAACERSVPYLCGTSTSSLDGEPMNTTTSLPQLLHSFFHDWMGAQRNASRHTIISYRDCWRLFLRFVAERRQRNVARLGLTDLTAEEIVAFLDHIEKDRGAAIATRNCRLAALHNFFRFVA